MLDKRLIEEKINNLIQEKGYDIRVVPMLNAFFNSANIVYNYTEEELEQALQNYGQNVKTIEFYNIGVNNYRYTRTSKRLVYDRDFIEKINEKNIESYIQTIIKSNSIITTTTDDLSILTNINQLSYLANLYDKTDEIYKSINAMIASTFALSNKNVSDAYKNVNDEMKKTDRNKESDKYDLLACDHTVLMTINDRIKDVQEGRSVKENYAAIYTLCLLEMKIRVTDYKMTDDKTLERYVKLAESFNVGRQILGITDEELDTKIKLDRNNWYINPTVTIRKIEEEIKGYTKLDTYIEESETQQLYDRKELIRKQREANKSVDFNLSNAEIEQNVRNLIQRKNYPEEFSTVLTEFFKRSVEEFEWTSETFYKKIKNLEQNVDSFVYKEKDEHIIAGYDALTKQITMSNSIVSLNNKEIATTLMHELKHATDDTQRDHETYERGFVYGEKYYKSKGLNELVTEATAIRIKGENPYNDKYSTTYILNGYDELSYATTMICSSLGLTETEFVKQADNGYIKFKEEIDDKYPGLEISGKIDKFNEILNNMYNDNNGGIKTKQSMSKGYSELYNVLEDIYEKRTEYERGNSDYDEKKARYEEYRLNKNMVLAQKRLRIKKDIINETIPDYKQVIEKSKVKKDEKPIFIDYAKQMLSEYKLQDNKVLEEAGKEIRKYKKRSRVKTKIKLLNSGNEEPQNSFEKKRKQFLNNNKENVDFTSIVIDKEENVKKEERTEEYK